MGNSCSKRFDRKNSNDELCRRYFHSVHDTRVQEIAILRPQESHARAKIPPEAKTYCRHTPAVYDNQIHENTDICSQERHTKTEVPYPERIVQREEFGTFVTDLGSNLTKYQAKMLATGFDFKPPEIESIGGRDDAGHVFVTLAREKGIISTSDISCLINKLQLFDLHGVANQVNESFRRYQQNACVSRPGEYHDKKGIFISELKATYEDLYNAVEPIPYIRDRLFCVNRVFIGRGIEFLVSKDKVEGEGTWNALTTYHNMFDSHLSKGTRSILEGEPGYGKSTLTLQLAYDWCHKIEASYLKYIDVFILLRLRQMRGVTSIYRAIKQFLLPKDSKLSEEDITFILDKRTSVVIVLDGFDEYPDSGKDTDFMQIISRRMFQEFEVILTTRSSYLPSKYPPLTKRLRLTGFDDTAQENYIRKAVVRDNVEAAMKIKQRLKENSVLSDLCQVPLFFVMFAHMSHESEQFVEFKSVTSIFRFVISCFHSHMKNKLKNENVRMYDLFEKEHSELDKLAFQGLSGKKEQIVWIRKDIRQLLGHDFYDQYVRLGILVEEEVLDIEQCKYETKVEFYHKLFCEWYAAHHLSKLASQDRIQFKALKKIQIREDYFKYLDPINVQYVYRFACGINPQAGEKIIAYLKSRKQANKFAILCILEQDGKFVNIEQNVREICSSEVTIKDNDSQLLQRSTIQILEIASVNETYISSLYLRNCYKKVDLSGGNYLYLKSNHSLPVLTTLKTLTIHEEGREITEEEFTSILQYSSKCMELKNLGFSLCLVPRCVKFQSLSALASRDVEVVWYPNLWYRLNLVSGSWEHEGKAISDEEYQKRIEYLQDNFEVEKV